jgi:hypothetical protein
MAYPEDVAALVDPPAGSATPNEILSLHITRPNAALRSVAAYLTSLAANSIGYLNTASGMAATTVQAAVDELQSDKVSDEALLSYLAESRLNQALGVPKLTAEAQLDAPVYMQMGFVARYYDTTAAAWPNRGHVGLPAVLWVRNGDGGPSYTGTAGVVANSTLDFFINRATA